MKISEAAKEIMKAEDGIDDLQITIEDEEVKIYWDTISLDVSAKDFPKALGAIQLLSSLGAKST